MAQGKWDEDLGWLQVGFNTAMYGATAATLLRCHSPLGQTIPSHISGKFRMYCPRSTRRESCGQE